MKWGVCKAYVAVNHPGRVRRSRGRASVKGVWSPKEGGFVAKGRFSRVSDGTLPLTFEGNFMMVPPLVGLDLDAMPRHLPYLT